MQSDRVTDSQTDSYIQADRQTERQLDTRHSDGQVFRQTLRWTGIKTGKQLLR